MPIQVRFETMKCALLEAGLLTTREGMKRKNQHKACAAYVGWGKKCTHKVPFLCDDPRGRFCDDCFNQIRARQSMRLGLFVR
jgi:hypothetical protein